MFQPTIEEFKTLAKRARRSFVHDRQLSVLQRMAGCKTCSFVFRNRKPSIDHLERFENRPVQVLVERFARPDFDQTP